MKKDIRLVIRDYYVEIGIIIDLSSISNQFSLSNLNDIKFYIKDTRRILALEGYKMTYEFENEYDYLLTQLDDLKPVRFPFLKKKFESDFKFSLENIEKEVFNILSDKNNNI